MNNKCPLCNWNGSTMLAAYGVIGPSKYDCRMVRCDSCEHYFSTSTKDIDFEQLYSGEQYEVIDTRGSLFDKILSIDDGLIIWQLSKFVSNKTLLDFGCGKGQFINRALKYGWQVKGIETAKERAEFGINKYGLDISTSEYKTGLVKGAPFNAITLFHVLEHLTEPKELLKELVENNLTQDGCLVIEVPLFGSLQSTLAGKHWIHIDPPLHISHFTKNTLSKLLNDLDLKPIKYHYFSIRLGVYGMVQSIMSLFGYRKNPITELKYRRTKSLIICILLLLPLASFLELIAVIFNKGGIMRVYCNKSSDYRKSFN
jgi:SAM-dependent methyltransferase